jgi:hypothetical protein
MPLGTTSEALDVVTAKAAWGFFAHYGCRTLEQCLF